jgi:hypothetical protein
MFNSDKCECAAACYHECVCDWVVKKQWQGLSDEEIKDKAIFFNVSDISLEDFIGVIDRTLKDKNEK